MYFIMLPFENNDPKISISVSMRVTCLKLWRKCLSLL
jgi:hypothetical protein